MGKAQRIVDGHEKKVQEAKLINTETWAGPHDSSGILVLFTDTVLVTDTRISVLCNQQHCTSQLFTLNFTSMNYTADQIYYASMYVSCKHISGMCLNIFIM